MIGRHRQEYTVPAGDMPMDITLKMGKGEMDLWEKEEKGTQIV